MIFEGYYIDHKLDHMVEASVPQEARQMRHHVGHVGGSQCALHRALWRFARWPATAPVAAIAEDEFKIQIIKSPSYLFASWLQALAQIQERSQALDSLL